MLSTDEGLVGLSIVIYTIFVYTLLLPMTIKQQKTSRITASKMSAKMNPEIQAIQKKYANKKDQASQLKMREEMQRVYDKYGTSMTGGCVQILIQMPLLFALYPVIYQMENYVPAIKTATADVQKFLTIPDLSMSPSQMMKVKDTFDVAPIFIVITCIALPVISALTQYFSLKLSQKITDTNNKKNGVQVDPGMDMASQTMRSMNITMPLFSLWMVFSLSAGIGVYWIVSAVVRCIQQVIINKYLDRISIEDIIEKNKEKAAKKRAKREVRAEKMNEMAQMNAKNIESSNNKSSKSTLSNKERVEKLQKAEASRSNAKAGSLSSKANMVKKYNDDKK